MVDRRVRGLTPEQARENLRNRGPSYFMSDEFLDVWDRAHKQAEADGWDLDCWPPRRITPNALP